MVEICRVELETEMDRNDDLLDAPKFRNRMTNRSFVGRTNLTR